MTVAEYHNKFITKLAGGNPRYGCYGLAVTIFSLGIIRDAMCVIRLLENPFPSMLTSCSYERAMRVQPSHPLLLNDGVTYLAIGLIASGNILVLTSMWALGVTGTYLGDYFGILMDHKVESFPFNVTDAPMYWGSTMSFLGAALWYGRPAGILLTGLVYVAYSIALRFEDPFTAMIYSKRDEKRSKKAT